MPGLVSAAGLVGYLDEPDNALQVFALEQLKDNIDDLWTEVVSSISKMFVGLVRPYAMTDIITARHCTKMHRFRTASSRRSSLPRSTTNSRHTTRAW